MAYQDPDVAQRYFDQLALPVSDASMPHRAALARAHELRKFEIENYWKRSAYFWGFQLVSFAALALSAKEGRFYAPIVLLVAVLGALAALTGVLTAKGSKFWQANWESHVDFLESAVEGRLHTTALVEDNVPYSVSRVNERFLEVLLAGWIIVFLTAAAVLAFPRLTELNPCTAAAAQITLPLIALIVGAWRIVKGQRSRLRGRAFLRNNMNPWEG
jgi:hypothetical protein